MHKFNFPQSLRTRLEAKLAALPDTEQRMDLIRELQVGELFIRSGCTIDHEPHINGKTPDWKVSRCATEFLVEVTRLRNEDIISSVNGLHFRIEALRSRIQKLQFDAHIHMNAEIDIQYGFATPFFNLDGVTAKVESWLSSNVDEPLVYEEFTFEKRKTTSNGVIVTMAVSYARPSNHYRFLQKLEEKINQRHELTTLLPYVIVVVNEFDSGTTLRACAMGLDDPLSTIRQVLWPSIPYGKSPLVQAIVILEPDAGYWRASAPYITSECGEVFAQVLESFSASAMKIQGKGPDTL